jgi:hypothetical protein
MNIPIKSIGYNIGTIGWLAKGLESGTLKLEEGKLKSNGNHGLWLKGEREQFLAAFNRFGFTTGDYNLDIKYNIAGDYPNDRDPIWTNAAWDKLMEIAQKWCDEKNEIRESDKLVKTV